jgi:hypothetical protein
MAWPPQTFRPVAFLGLGAEDVDASVVDRILQPRVLAVRAVAVVALHEHDLFADEVQLCVTPMPPPKHSTAMAVRKVPL